jgi:hypothetical protein
MKTGSSPPGYDDLLAYHEIPSLVDKSVAEYNTIVGSVRAHQGRIAEERAALGALHTRLVGMRKALKEWERQVWDMWLRDVGSREACRNTKQRLHAQEMLLDDLIWQLFDFSEKTDDGGQP